MSASGPTTPNTATNVTSRFPVMPATLDSHQQRLHDRIASGPRGGVRGPLALWLYSPELAEHAQALGEYLRYRSVFPPRLSEFIILIVARHLDCDYEWSAHGAIAERAGVPPAVIDAVRQGSEPPLDDPDFRLLYAFVTQVLRTNRVTDAVHADMARTFGDKGVIEATAIVGYYCMAGFALNVAEVVSNGERLPKRG